MKLKSLIFAVLGALLVVSTSGCATDLIVSGHKYETYGVFNKDEVRDPGVKYSLSVGNVIWGCVLVETIIAPVYFFGFSMYEPVGLKVTPPNAPSTTDG